MLVALASCSGAPTEPYLTHIGDLSSAMEGAKTFGLHPHARYVNSRPGDFAFDIRGSMDGAIGKVFTEAGYSVTGHTHADRVIAYAIGANEHMRDEKVQEIFGISPEADAAPGISRGALVIAVLDANSNVVFRAAASGPIEEAPMRNADLQRKNILKAVRDLLIDLPQK